MNLRKPAKVVEWRPDHVPLASPKHRSARRSWSKATGLVGTLCLHGVVFQLLLYGTRAPKIKPPDEQGTGASRMVSDTPPADTLILINPIEPVVTKADPLEELSSSGALASDLSVAILSPDPLPILKIEDSEKADDPAVEPSVDSTNIAGRAQMFGRYTGQIDARIERAWRRPRSPVSGLLSDVSVGPAETPAAHDESFSCQVRIVQNARGFVQETLLLKCNGSPEWQRSLIVAINQSSPLPAPPIPSVFSSALTLTFTATAYQSGDSVDGYETNNRHREYSSAGSPFQAAIGSQTK